MSSGIMGSGDFAYQAQDGGGLPCTGFTTLRERDMILHRLYVFCCFMIVWWLTGVASAAEVRIQQVEVAVSPVGPVVLLRAESKVIPVFVDATVAESIRVALSGGTLHRPFPHNLMHTILTAYGGKVTQVAITLKESTYHAALTVQLRNETKVFDSRASDAIALATHFKAPILVSRELLDAQGKVIDVPGAQSL